MFALLQGTQSGTLGLLRVFDDIQPYRNTFRLVYPGARLHVAGDNHGWTVKGE